VLKKIKVICSRYLLRDMSRSGSSFSLRRQLRIESLSCERDRFETKLTTSKKAVVFLMS